MSESGVLRFAVAGPGFIGRVHARALARTEGAALVAVLGAGRENLERFAREFGVERRYTSSAELAGDAEVDAVIVATPNDLHAPLACEMLAAGKHVLVEKPLALDATQAREIGEAARRAGCLLMVGHMWRFDREAQALRAAVEAGRIGRVVKTKGYGIHANWGPSGWFTDPARAGGGALIDMGVHAIDTVRYLLGDPEPVAVYARIATRYGDYAVDDLGLLLITWANGTESLVECGWWNPHADGIEASTQLYGTDGYARLFPTKIARIVDHKPVAEPLTFPERESHMDPHIFAGQIAELVAAVRERRDPVPGAAHGLTVMRICDAAYRSAREGRRVEIEA